LQQMHVWGRAPKAASRSRSVCTHALFCGVRTHARRGPRKHHNNAAPAQETKPTYRELETLLRKTEGSNSGLTWVQRLQSEFTFNKDSLNQ